MSLSTSFTKSTSLSRCQAQTSCSHTKRLVVCFSVKTRSSSPLPLCPLWRVVGWGQYQLIFVFSRLFVSSFCLPIVLTDNIPFSPVHGWSLPPFLKPLSTILFLSVFSTFFCFQCSIGQSHHAYSVISCVL